MVTKFAVIYRKLSNVKTNQGDAIVYGVISSSRHTVTDKTEFDQTHQGLIVYSVAHITKSIIFWVPVGN